MQIDITGTNIHASEAIQEHIFHRLESAFDRFEQRIPHVQVRINDTNGPRGGIDKRCQVQTTIPHVGTFVIEETHRDLYAAIDLAMDRLRQSVSRKLSRNRQRRRRPGHGRNGSAAKLAA
jgi:putative sigma-54 modulation protein